MYFKVPDSSPFGLPFNTVIFMIFLLIQKRCNYIKMIYITIVYLIDIVKKKNTFLFTRQVECCIKILSKGFYFCNCIAGPVDIHLCMHKTIAHGHLC